MSHHWLIWAGIGYFCGSIPFGLLIGLAKGIDIRHSGSGNVGATNTGRVLGKKWGVVCFSLDLLKGTAPVLIGGWFMGYAGQTLTSIQAWQWLSVAATAMLGHIFPIWLRFAGGKGVATGLGVLLGFWPLLTIPALASAVIWVVVLAMWRFVSLASMIAAGSIPLLLVVHAYFRQQTPGEIAPFLLATGALSILVVIRHRSNITRLRGGSEPKIGSLSP